MTTIGQITDDSYKTMLETSTLVLVDFWAPWCGPCRIIEPVVENIAQQFEGQLKVVKVNVDEHILLANKYDVRGIPTLGLFKRGELVERFVGANVTQAQLSAAITDRL